MCFSPRNDIVMLFIRICIPVYMGLNGSFNIFVMSRSFYLNDIPG